MNILTKELLAHADKEYKAFQCRLMPTVPQSAVLGVRMPHVRETAKKYAGSDCARDFLASLPHEYYDENNLHGALISREKDFDTALRYTVDFLPYIDNWATCDMTKPAVFAGHTDKLFPHILGWLSSGREFTVRFGLEMLMNFYLDDGFDESILHAACSVKCEKYYESMMLAWFLATALAKHYSQTVPFLERRVTDRVTHNKAIQKAIESRRITPQQKQYLRLLKY